MVKETSFFCS